MCVHEMNRVKQHSQLKDGYRFLLTMIADGIYGSTGTGALSISRGRLAELMGCSLRAVDNRIKVAGKTPELYVAHSAGMRGVNRFVLLVGCDRDEIIRRLKLNAGMDDEAAATEADAILRRGYPEKSRPSWMVDNPQNLPLPLGVTVAESAPLKVLKSQNVQGRGADSAPNTEWTVFLKEEQASSSSLMAHSIFSALIEITTWNPAVERSKRALLAATETLLAAGHTADDVRLVGEYARLELGWVNPPNPSQVPEKVKLARAWAAAPKPLAMASGGGAGLSWWERPPASAGRTGGIASFINNVG